MKRPWSSFIGVRSKNYVIDFGPARDVSPNDLMVMRSYRLAERRAACGGHDPIQVIVAYAQNELAYDARGKIVTNKDAARLPREERVNKFGLSYRRSIDLFMHKILADIVIGAAIYLYKTHHWTTVLYDGLRTVDGAFKLYGFAPDKDIEDGLLALPGQSAHNKGLAVDSMMMDMHGYEVDMGGHFDHLDMSTNNRTYNGKLISEAAKQNRLIREGAFLRSAFTQGLLVAPLKSEFWDDRLPENREDLWRVLDSAARCLGIRLLTEEDDKLRKENREAFSQKWERWSYSDFLAQWRKIFHGQETKLEKILGVTMPPLREKPEFYHGNYHPIYDESLKASGKNLTDL